VNPAVGVTADELLLDDGGGDVGAADEVVGAGVLVRAAGDELDEPVPVPDVSWDEQAVSASAPATAITAPAVLNRGR